MERQQRQKSCKGCTFSENWNRIRKIGGCPKRGPSLVALCNTFCIKIEQDVAFALLLHVILIKT